MHSSHRRSARCGSGASSSAGLTPGAFHESPTSRQMAARDVSRSLASSPLPGSERAGSPVVECVDLRRLARIRLELLTRRAELFATVRLATLAPLHKLYGRAIERLIEATCTAVNPTEPAVTVSSSSRLGCSRWSKLTSRRSRRPSCTSRRRVSAPRRPARSCNARRTSGTRRGARRRGARARRPRRVVCYAGDVLRDPERAARDRHAGRRADAPLASCRSRARRSALA